MSYKKILADSMLDECRIIQHLYSKIPAAGMDYRPTPEQRSTLELLRYVATIGEAATSCVIANKWDGYREIADRCKEMTADQFPEMMDIQIKNMGALLDSLTDEDLVNKMTAHVTGQEFPLGEGLLNLPLKWLTGYRMQLFLYAKQAGNADISTANCWIGMDQPKKD